MVRRRQAGARHIRHGAAFWRQAVKRQEDSGRSQVGFCADEGLALSTFSYWRRKLAEEGQATLEQTSLVPIEVVPDALGEVTFGQVPFELVLRSGHLIRVPPNFNEAALARLVSVLETDRC